MDLSLTNKVLSFKFNQLTKKELLILLGILIGLELLVLIWQYRPIPRTHFVESFRLGKVRLVQQGDKISGKGQTGEKFRISLTPGEFKKELKVNKSGFWLLKIPSNTPAGKYTINIEPANIQANQSTQLKKYKIRVIQSNYWSILAGLLDFSR